MSITSIAERAVLARLHVSQWMGTKADLEATKGVHTAHGATARAGIYSKRLLPAHALGVVQGVVSAARAYHTAHTLPWGDDHSRLLPTPMFMEYGAYFRDIQGEYHKAVDTFIQHYPQYVKDAKEHLGKLHNSADYPSAEEVAEKFSLRADIYPVPSGSDFRITLSKSDEKRIRSELDDRVKAAVDTAIKSLWKRLYETVEHMVERLKMYHVGRHGNVSNPFRDSIVENIRELTALLPSLNVTGDKALEQMVLKLNNELCGCDVGILREDDRARAKTVKTAEDILEKMRGYVGA